MPIPHSRSQRNGHLGPPACVKRDLHKAHLQHIGCLHPDPFGVSHLLHVMLEERMGTHAVDRS